MASLRPVRELLDRWDATHRSTHMEVRPALARAFTDALRGAGLDVEEPEQWSGPMDFIDVDALVAY